MLKDFSIISPFLDGLRPPEKLNVLEWSDKYKYLSSKSSAQPGLYSSNKIPYIKEILLSLSPDSSFKQIVVKKAAQVGLTEAGYCLAGYHIDIDPCPILYILPTEKLCKDHSKDRLDSMIEASPTLRDKIAGKRDRDGGNTKMSKDFPGGTFYYASAGVADDLRSKPIRIVIMDEVSTWSGDLKGEGSPIVLAEKRTSTFSNKKIFKLSTPTTEGNCLITDEYEKTDKRKFKVPCPHCSSFQFLEFENLKWEKGDYDSVRYICQDCNEPIQERFKSKMFAKGFWEATDLKKSSKTRVGYHINALYSPLGWYSWKEMAQEWEEAQTDESRLKSFINTVLGETWKDQADVPEEKRLWERKEDYPVNVANIQVAFITCGIDIQADRVEAVIIGWGKGKENWTLDRRVMVGDVTKPEVWGKVTELINEKFIRTDGVQIPIQLTAIDSGYKTQIVYDYCKNFTENRVIAIKGDDKLKVIVSVPKQVQVSRAGKKIGTSKVWNIGVSIIKEELYGWLRLTANEDNSFPPGYCHHPQFDLDFFKSLTAEHLVRYSQKAGVKYQWEKRYQRNEVLDCTIYARAAASVIGIDRMTDEHFENMSNSYGLQNDYVPQKKKPSVWDRWK